MRHTFYAFLSGMLLLSMFFYAAVFSQHTFAATKIANRYVASVGYERSYHLSSVGKAIDTHQPNSAFHPFTPASMGRLQRPSISFQPSLSQRHIPPLPSLQAKWPDGQNGRGRNNVTTGYEIGV